MKRILPIVILIVLAFQAQQTRAQSLNWATLHLKRHLITANFGFDYSLAYGLGYGYKVTSELPVVVCANLSLPAGERVFDDLKAKVGVQYGLLNTANFVGAVSVFGIYRTYQTPLVQLQNFGCDVAGTFGYYRPRWFIAAEVGFDKAIVTRFDHTDKYRREVYADVVDGWYEPATGGNFRYGFQVGYSFSKWDITLAAGRVVSQDFKTSPLLPFYASIGVNFSIGE